MVAQINSEVFHHTPCTPERDPFDSDGVLLALETARGLEGDGDFAGAVQWLRRAAREAEKDGNVVRAVDLADAAAYLASKVDPDAERIMDPTAAPSSNAMLELSKQVVRSKIATAPIAQAPAHRAERIGVSAPPPPASIPPLLAKLISSMPPFSSRGSTEIPPPPTPSQLSCERPPSRPIALASQPSRPSPEAASRVAEPTPHTASAIVANDNLATPPVSHPRGEPSSSVCAFRAAIPVSGQRLSSFFIQRLASGQRAPEGMVEAMIVVTSESDIVSFEASLSAKNVDAGA